MGSVEVEVNRATILAEAAAAAAEAPAEPTAAPANADAAAAAPGGADAGAAPSPDLVTVSPDELASGMRMAAAEACNMLAPAWEITAEESDPIGNAAALCIQYWAPPGAIHPKYVALLALAGSIYAVARRRRNPDGTYPPLHKAPPKAPAPAAPPAGPVPPNNVTPLRV